VNVQGRKRTLTIGLGGVIVLALAAWFIGGQIRSPAQIAAETSAPDPSAITVPVEQRVLSSDVIVRGTVRYGSPQPVVLATSESKQSNASSSPVDIVTNPPRRGARVGEGSVAMTVSGRPVFVMRGAQAAHRDLGPGKRGPDVRQLEQALNRMGFFPGRIDGRFDGQTAGAVASFYEKRGWEPFGPTNLQLEQLRAARAAATQARDAYLQSRVVTGGALPADIAQARIDVETARDVAETALRDRASQRGAVNVAIQNARRDNALASAEIATRTAALNRARDAVAEAERSLATAPPDTSATERAALEVLVRQAKEDVTVAQADLNASRASARATRAGGENAVATARGEYRRAQRAVPRTQRQVVLAERRLAVLEDPSNVTLKRLVTQNAAAEARSAAAEARRLARQIGIQVPADEVLFFPTLPLRVDNVRAKRGDSVGGRVMTVSNSRLAVDSSLSINDAKLVRNGAPVTIEEPDLGVKTTGTVTLVADRPGTHQADPGRIYLEVTPKTAPAQLVGTSVKLTIGIKSTRGEVLVVPLTALSVGAGGEARVQVQRAGGRLEYVEVNPGLAAKGLVEITPTSDGQLKAGDLVVVGSRGSTAATAPPTSVTGASGATGGGSSSPGGATGSRGSGTTGPSGAGGSAAQPPGTSTTGAGRTGATGPSGTTP
jgi:peptidoglycan hydrolase-like protein with peptidoglycan-binding domain